MAGVIRHLVMAGMVCLAIYPLSGCSRRDEPQSPEPNRSEKPSAAMPVHPSTPEETLEVRLYAQWQAKVQGLDLKQVRGRNESNKTMRNLVGALSAEEFELLCTHVKAVSHSTMTQFQSDLLIFTAMRMIRSGERARLVSLLAEHCPRAIPPAPMEFTLAAEERSGTLQDGFTVLVDAYRAANNDEARATLLVAMEAAMPSLRTRIPDDAAFVTAVETWHAVRNRQLPDLRPRYVFAWRDHRFAQGSEELFETP